MITWQLKTGHVEWWEVRAYSYIIIMQPHWSSENLYTRSLPRWSWAEKNPTLAIWIPECICCAKHVSRHPRI